MLKNIIFFGLIVISPLKDSLAAIHPGDEGVNVEMILVPETNLRIPHPNQEIVELFARLDSITRANASTWYPYFLGLGQNLWVASNTAAAAYLGLSAAVQYFERDQTARTQIMNLINNYINHFRQLNVPDAGIPAFYSLSELNNHVTAKDQEMTNLENERRREELLSGVGPSNAEQDDDPE